jgi:hypothetical protein
VAVEESQKMQMNYIMDALAIPGLAPKLGKKAVQALATHGVEQTDAPQDVRDAVARQLQRSQDESMGIGGTIASTLGSVSGLLGPVGNIIGLGAGAYQASQVPSALVGFGEQMGMSLSMPKATQQTTNREVGSSERPQQQVVDSQARPEMPLLPADIFSNMGLTQQHFRDLLNRASSTEYL